MPLPAPPNVRWTASSFLVVAVIVLISFTGCSTFIGGGLFGLGDKKDDDAALKKLLKAPAPPDLIRQAAIANGMNWVRVEGVGVVNSLPGTGGAPQPSTMRDLLLEEMKRNDIVDPNAYLERDDTVMVQVVANIPPGARRGDPLDLLVTTPVDTEASDLHGGWLLDTRMRYQQVIRNAIRSSEVMAIGTGPVLTRYDHEGTEDDALKVQGRILSGGVVQVDRKISLVLRPEFQHVSMSKAIGAAINRRFYFYDGTTRRGIAKPLEDDLIEIEIHPRYRENEQRMMEVIRALGVAPESSDTQTRLLELGQKLKSPATAADAALQMEGLGEGAIPTLIDGCASANPELRFYAAEALAYLDRREAIEPLVASIRADAAFRAPALEALRGLEHRGVVDAVRGLFNDASLETRYGAFVTLRRRGDAASVIGGENLNGAFRLYTVASTASPAVVVSLDRSPEIVLMGTTSPVRLKSFLRGPSGLLLKVADNPERIRISRFQPGQEDARTEVSTGLADVLKGIASVGGGYGDAVAFLRIAKTEGVLVDQLAMDPLPRTNRIYHRDEEPETTSEAPDSTSEKQAE